MKLPKPTDKNIENITERVFSRLNSDQSIPEAKQEQTLLRLRGFIKDIVIILEEISNETAIDK